MQQQEGQSTFLVAFEQGVDDFVGRPRVLAWAFASSAEALPSRLGKLFDMDCGELSLSEFHDQLKQLLDREAKKAEGEAVPGEMALYGGHLESQHDGVPTLVPLNKLMTAKVWWQKDVLQEFLSTGELANSDPPVLSAKVEEVAWKEGGSGWGWTCPGSRAANLWPINGVEILVDSKGEYGGGDSVKASFQGEREEPHFFMPSFSAFERIE